MQTDSNIIVSPRATRNQVFFVFLTCILMCCIALWRGLSGDGLRAITSFSILCVLFLAIFLFLKTKFGSSISAIFALAMLLRVVACIILELGPPFTYRGTYLGMLEYPTHITYWDDYFYALKSEHFSSMTVSEVFKSDIVWDHQPYRTAAVMSVYKIILGKAPAWGRMVGAIIGSITATLIVLSCRRVLSGKAFRFSALISVFGPQLIFVSVIFLKEVWCIFAASICLYGFIRLNERRGLLWEAIISTVGILLMFWFRFEVGVILSLCAFGVLFITRTKSRELRVFGTGALLFGFAVFIFFFGSQFEEKMTEQATEYSVGEKSESKTLTFANQLTGPVRLIHSVILYINPPPKGIFKVIIPSKEWVRNITVQADTFQWWIMAPMILIGMISINKDNRKYFWVVVSYLFLWVIASYVRNGINPEAARYRDSLLPFAILIFGFGVERYITYKVQRYRFLVFMTYFVALSIGIYMIVRDYL